MRLDGARLFRDPCGAVYVEFVVAVMPVLTAFLCVVQLTDLFAAKLIVQHAAYRAARAGAVVFPDNPSHYEGPTRLGDVEKAAYAVLLAKPSLIDARIAVPTGTDQYQPGQDVRVIVTATYDCRFPIANRLVCPGFQASPTRIVRAEARLPAHAADYPYESP
jgi:hypothetical protein